MGPKSQEFLDLLLVPLAASVIPLRKSLERLNQRFGERQVVTLLQNKAIGVGGLGLALPIFYWRQIFSITFYRVLSAVQPNIQI